MMSPAVFNRSFFDFDADLKSTEINWYTDAATNTGLGGICCSHWFIGEWSQDFMTTENPSINYLELFAVMVGVLNWAHLFKNQSITLFCDNMSVVHMVNTMSSKCKNCMVLLRIIVLQALTHNVRIRVKHVPGILNRYSDFLSRLKYKEFRQLARSEGMKFDNKPTEIPEEVWPMEKIWFKQ